MIVVTVAVVKRRAHRVTNASADPRSVCACRVSEEMIPVVVAVGFHFDLGMEVIAGSE